MEGLPGRNVSPDAARWDPDMGLYNLDNDHVDDALEFARSVFHHACVVCDWDPALLGSAEGSPAPVR